jgi:hypothetical protein
MTQYLDILIIPEHENYVKKLLDDFYDAVCSMISSAEEQDSEQLTSSHQEIIQHIEFAKSLSSSFVGREKLLSQVEEYIKTGDK